LCILYAFTDEGWRDYKNVINDVKHFF
jgi:hypothetical protein